MSPNSLSYVFPLADSAVSLLISETNIWQQNLLLVMNISSFDVNGDNSTAHAQTVVNVAATRQALLQVLHFYPADHYFTDIPHASLTDSDSVTDLTSWHLYHKSSSQPGWIQRSLDSLAVCWVAHNTEFCYMCMHCIILLSVAHLALPYFSHIIS